MRVPAAQHILPHDRDSAGPAPGGACQAELGGKLPRSAAWPGITSPFSQMAVLLLCISVEAAVRATSLKVFPGRKCILSYGFGSAISCHAVEPLA